MSDKTPTGDALRAAMHAHITVYESLGAGLPRECLTQEDFAIEELAPRPHGAYQTLVERVQLLREQRGYASDEAEVLRAENTGWRRLSSDIDKEVKAVEARALKAEQERDAARKIAEKYAARTAMRISAGTLGRLPMPWEPLAVPTPKEGLSDA